MGLNDLDSMPPGSRVTIDSAPIIYLLEANPKFLAPYLPLFDRIEQGQLQGVVSAVTLAEVLAGPLRHDNEILADRYYQALTANPNWQFQPMSAEISLMAARVRVRYGVRLPDAVQVATALYSQSAALVTHDRDFSSIKDLAVLSA